MTFLGLSVLALTRSSAAAPAGSASAASAGAESDGAGHRADRDGERVDSGIRRAGEQRDRRQRVDELVRQRVDRNAHGRPRSGAPTRRLWPDAWQQGDDRFGVARLCPCGRRLEAAEGRSSRCRFRRQSRFTCRCQADGADVPLRAGLRDRQRRHAALRRRAAAVRRRPRDRRIPLRGADLSFTPLEEAAGTVFTDRGESGSALHDPRDHGANYVRLRLWINPPPGYNDLARRPRDGPAHQGRRR